MGDVIQADFATVVDIPCEAILNGALNSNLEEVFVVGFESDGSLYLASSTANMPDLLWMLERAKHKLMKTADVQESCPMDVA